MVVWRPENCGPLPGRFMDAGRRVPATGLRPANAADVGGPFVLRFFTRFRMIPREAVCLGPRQAREGVSCGWNRRVAFCGFNDIGVVTDM